MPTPKLYNVKTKKSEQLTPEEAQNAILAGTHQYDRREWINVVGSDGKAAGSVASGDLTEAFKQGYRLETPEEKRINDYVDAHKGIGGAIQVGASQALNQLAFGIPGSVADETGSPEETAKREALKAAHPVANILGGAIGTIGNLAATGGVVGAIGKAAEGTVLAGRAASAVGMGTRVAASAARLGAEGAALAAPKAVTEAALGHPEQAAETMLYSTAFGAGLGAGGSLLKGATKGLLNIAGKPFNLNLDAANPLASMAEEQATRSLNYGTNAGAAKAALALPGGTAGLGRTLIEEDMLRQPTTIFGKGGESFADYATRLGERKSQAGEEVSSLYKGLDQLVANSEGNVVSVATPSQLSERMKAMVVDPLRKLTGKEKIVGKLEDMIGQFERATTAVNEAKGLPANSPLSFEELFNQRKAIDDVVWKEGAIGITDPAKKEMRQFRDILQSEIETRGEEASKLAGTSFKDKLDKANLTYRRFLTAEETAKKSAASELSRRNFSLSDYLVGGFGGVSAMGALSHPIGAVVGLAGGIANKYARENGNLLLAHYGDQLGLFFADRAVQAGEKQFSRIPDIIKSLAKPTIAAVKIAPMAGFTRFLGGEHDEKNKQELFNKVSDKLISFASGDDQHTDRLTNVASTLSMGAPNVASAYTDKATNAYNYLYKHLPKKGGPDYPLMPKAFKPSDKEIASFNKRLEVATNPFSAFDHLQNRTLSKEHVETLQALYPKTYSRMVDRINDYAYGTKAAPTSRYNQDGLSMFMGQDLTGKRGRTGQYQKLYGAIQAPQIKPIKFELPNQLTDVGRMTYGVKRGR